ncbi:MAG: PIN domain-containing protein [Elainella sp. Prado103]|nr:PIN domain-containing protein [Elainella sp. Prado103]
MSGRFLLDTNIVIALFADEAIVKENLAQAGEVFIPSIVIGELCYGARKSMRYMVRIEPRKMPSSSQVAYTCWGD